jgi:hypothetical protein
VLPAYNKPCGKILLHVFKEKKGSQRGSAEDAEELTLKEVQLLQELHKLGDSGNKDEGVENVKEDLTDNNLEGWVDEIEEISAEERKELRKVICPVQTVSTCEGKSVVRVICTISEQA